MSDKSTIDKIIQGFIIGCSVIGLIALIAALLTLPTYYLWNWLMPLIFGLKRITLWQALGLNLLSGVLFHRYGGK